ncbi:hypothetical protein [Thalassoglobus polymorphus]|uniref:Uncharacterized protein n=1 Tax=Thalassoglobus polymorphus TaxID=2527994 RepID=A0A517QL52_9PLAN|nr:hypothetical protein [Thalassoglobus polymorphus]QDT32341.1 hypothetical protein Mal48_15850 [Thalassoglobus polymorphus]
MPEPLLYLKSIGAASIAVVMSILMLLSLRRTQDKLWHTSVCVISIAIGVSIGFRVMSWQFAWPPMNGMDRLIEIVIPATLAIELFAGNQRVPRWCVWFLRISLALAIPRILLHGSVYLSGADVEWTAWQAAIALTMSSGLLAGVWGLLDWLFNRSPGASIPLALCLAMPCAGAAVMMSGYIKGGAATVPLTGTLTAATIMTMLITNRLHLSTYSGGQAILGIGVVSLFGVLFIGCFFGRLSTYYALTILASPVLCWATELSYFRNRKRGIVGALRIVLVSIPLVTVLVLAKLDFDRHMAPLMGNEVQAIDFQKSIA